MRSGAAARTWTGALLALPLLLFLSGLVLWPMGRLAAAAFAGPGAPAFRAVLAAGRYRTALGHSLLLSAAAALAAVALSLVPAWILAREPFRGRDLLRTAISLPLTFSGVLVGFLLIVLLGRIGAVPRLLEILTGRPFLAGLAYTPAGLFLAYLYFEVPRAVVTLESAFRRFPWELDAAARTLGAGPFARLVRAVLPLAAPALRSTLAITFSASMGSFGVALLLSRRLSVAPLGVSTLLTAFLHAPVAGARCLLLPLLPLTVDRLSGGRRARPLPRRR